MHSHAKFQQKTDNARLELLTIQQIFPPVLREEGDFVAPTSESIEWAKL